jgi:hypothetical protein
MVVLNFRQRIQLWHVPLNSIDQGVELRILLFDLDLLRDSNEPILFKDEKTSKVYIIQNVQGRDKETALNLAEYWKQYKFNFGYSPPKFKDVLQKPYVVYGITYDYKLDLEYVRNITEETTSDYLQVLHFENDYYATMLPIH